MEHVDVRQAGTDLPRLLDEVTAGKEVLISRDGRPVAKLVPVAASSRPRRPGSHRGRVGMSPDFNDPLPADVLAGFHGDRP